jgi:hypothetical protein
MFAVAEESSVIKENRLTVLVAVIAVVAAAGGAIAGGVASYWGNRSLEGAKSLAAARGTARVLQAQLRSVDVRLVTELQHNRLMPIDSAYDVGLSQEDRKLIAVHLSARDWQKVASALAAVDLYAGGEPDDAQRRANARQLVVLDEQRRSYVKSTSRIVKDGAGGLSSLAGIP